MLSTYHRLGVHVYDSDLAVIRAAAGKLDPKVRRQPAFRQSRKDFYREMLDHHRKAQELVARWRL